MHGSELLAAWRKARDLSQKAAADLVGVTQNTVSDWENRRKNPQIAHAVKLHDVSKDENGVPAVPMTSWGSTESGAPEPNGSAA